MGVDESPITAAAAASVGRVLAAAIGAVGRVRGPRPLHTTGLRLTGRLVPLPRGSARAGVTWIDEREAEPSPVVARLSRGAALPALLPDVIGLAVRVDGERGDLLLSSTGSGVPGRFLLRPRWTPARAMLSTLMPYRGADGPVLVAARSVSPIAMPARMEDVRGFLERRPWRLDLVWATPTGPWHRFARLELAPAAGAIDGATPRFDPVLHAPEGAGTYDWTRLLREPSYAVGRRPSRRAGSD